MSIRQGNNILAGTDSNGLNLFDFKWCDHTLNDLNWVLSDGEWKSGNTYKKMYQHLLDDFQNGEIGHSDTDGGVTVFYRLCPDGHKVCLEDQEQNVIDYYNANGSCWIYVLDALNKRFKLPRTKYGFVGLRDSVGKYVPESLPNITGSYSAKLSSSDAAPTGVFKKGDSANYCLYGSASGNVLDFDASESSSTYQDDAPVQQRATQMYLYFYADQFSKEANDLENSYNGHRTNCLTEIPQDIKLELNNGTLTLKAGSKLYIPNGFEQDGTTKKFNVVIIENDISTQDGVSSVDTYARLLYYRNGGLNVYVNSQSGTTTPSDSGNVMFYNTSDNTIKKYNSGTFVDGDWSLPLAIVSADGTNLYGTIDQVFNGFGYIGSTTFALPGVKVLVPNGRNEDGKLNNVLVSLTEVKTFTESVNNVPKTYITMNANGTLAGLALTANGKIRKYDEEENLVWNESIQKYVSLALLGTYTIEENSKITNFNPKTPFHSLDWNDKNEISTWSMPSNKYVDLTLGNSGDTYITPANGYVLIRTVANNGNCSITIHQTNGPTFGSSATVLSGDDGRLFVPFARGTNFRVWYSNIGTGSGTNATVFRFIYAEGEV